MHRDSFAKMVSFPNMKLYTKSDLERAARLSLLHRVRDPEGDPEWHIREAVGIVAAEGPEYLSREQAEEAVVFAFQLLFQDTNEKETDDDRNAAFAYAKKAVQIVLYKRGNN